jgi:hypothetical protein
MRTIKKPVYEKPELVKVDKMVFMFESLNGKSKINCRQCSGCHSCR